jgi:hypothetical protein
MNNFYQQPYYPGGMFSNPGLPYQQGGFFGNNFYAQPNYNQLGYYYPQQGFNNMYGGYGYGNGYGDYHHHHHDDDHHHHHHHHDD